MKRCLFVTCVLAASVLGWVFACPVLAGFQIKRPICELTWNEWEFTEREGRLGVESNGPRGKRWFVLAPTITTAQGSFIASDPAGKEPWLRLVREKGPHAKWTFEITQTWAPSPTRNRGDRYLNGTSGFRFRMKQAEGPFKDWYVGVEPLPPAAPDKENQTPTWRPLILVKDPSAAAEFKYQEMYYEEGHK